MKYFNWVWKYGRGRSKWVWIISTVVLALSGMVLLGLSFWAYWKYFEGDPNITLPNNVVGIAALGLTLFFSACYGYICTNDNFCYKFWDWERSQNK